MGFWLAVKAFWTTLNNESLSKQIKELLDNVNGDVDRKIINDIPEAGQKCVEVVDKDSRRSEALELLASLQREARFIDFIKESLEGCDDATIGAVARNVHDRCASVLERCFEIRPLIDKEEGDSVAFSISEANNSSRFRFSRSISGSAESVQGRIVHAGWQALKCLLPTWTGEQQDSSTLAPIEIEN